MVLTSITHFLWSNSGDLHCSVSCALAFFLGRSHWKVVLHEICAGRKWRGKEVISRMQLSIRARDYTHKEPKDSLHWIHLNMARNCSQLGLHLHCTGIWRDLNWRLGVKQIRSRISLYSVCANTAIRCHLAQLEHHALVKLFPNWTISYFLSNWCDMNLTYMYIKLVLCYDLPTIWTLYFRFFEP